MSFAVGACRAPIALTPHSEILRSLLVGGANVALADVSGGLVEYGGDLAKAIIGLL